MQRNEGERKGNELQGNMNDYAREVIVNVWEGLELKKREGELGRKRSEGRNFVDEL
jgi:hypothetical protein